MNSGYSFGDKSSTIATSFGNGYHFYWIKGELYPLDM